MIYVRRPDIYSAPEHGYKQDYVMSVCCVTMPVVFLTESPFWKHLSVLVTIVNGVHFYLCSSASFSSFHESVDELNRFCENGTQISDDLICRDV